MVILLMNSGFCHGFEFVLPIFKKTNEVFFYKSELQVKSKYKRKMDKATQGNL